MKVLSLFDGISCARVALERAGISIEKYYASEIDKYAIQIAQKNYPDTIQLGDVNELIGETGLRKWLPDIDLMVLGFPCQDLSIAKKNRKGLDGERSGLFWKALEIHRYARPKWFIYENVASMKKEWKEQILKAIQEIEPSAYMIEINAALVSAQNRRRVFFTNIPNVKLPEDRGILLKDILEPKVAENYFVKPKSNTVRSSGRGSGINDKHNWDTIRVTTINKGGQGDRVYSPNGKSVGKTGLYAVPDKSYCVPSTYYKENVKSLVKRKKNGLFITEKNPLNESSVQSNCKNTDIIPDNIIIRKLTPIECERLQGVPDNYTGGVSNTQKYKVLGNAFNVDVVAHILSFLKRW